MKIISKEQYEKNGWWYSDGEQPVSNGDVAMVQDDDNKPYKIISCCSNCGDYNIIDMEDVIR